nr:unnamed protein product [Callosobruchus analis]
MSKEIVKEIILEKEFIDILVDRLAVKICEKMNDKLDAFAARIDEIEKKIKYIHDDQEELQLKVEEVQQQLKQNQLRIYGFSDCKGETLIRKVEEFLEGSKVIITEELVKSRYDLYQLAREKIGAMHVWTMNGKIFTEHNERKVHIRNEEDVLKINK